MSSETPHGAGIHEGVTQVFLGRQGLRAGWACLLFLAFLTLSTLLARVLTQLLHHGHPAARGTPMAPATAIIGEGISALAVVLVTWLMARIEGRPFSRYGLGDRRAFQRFAIGLLAGFAAISALVGFLWTRGLLTLSNAHLSATGAYKYALLWALAFLCVALFEETLLRGYLLLTLRRGIHFWPAAILLSAVFGLLHHGNPGESPVGLFSAAAVGLFLSLTLWYTGSLWWAIGFHTAWDWGESFFWSTPDSGLKVQGHLLNENPHGALLWSGGPTGPEGSLWVLPLLALCALIAWLWWRRSPPALSRYGVHPPHSAG